MRSGPRRWLLILSTLALLAGVLALAVPVGAQAATPVINEYVANHASTDTHEFIEVFGAPNTDYSTLTVLEIEGDSSGAGTVDGVFPVGTTNASGYWFTEFLGDEIENGTITLMLVDGFTGSVGDDIDTNNDGLVDNPLWTSILDDVGVYRRKQRRRSRLLGHSAGGVLRRLPVLARRCLEDPERRRHRHDRGLDAERLQRPRPPRLHRRAPPPTRRSTPRTR